MNTINSIFGRLFIVAGILCVAGLLGWWILYHDSGEQNGGKPDPKGRPGGFKDVAQASGINFRMAFLPNEQGENFKINLYDHGCGVAVADFDGDGFEDLYFLNQLGANALYRNQGDGTFKDVTQEAGVALGDRICVGATFADYDNDGHPDLFVTSTRGGNVLFKNLGNGKFKDVTRAAGVTLAAHCQTAVFFDYDNDGFLDLFVTCTAKWTTDFDRAAGYYRGLGDLLEVATSPREYNVLYRNNGNGTFTDVTAKAGLKGVGWGGDTAAFDFDEDGDIDLFVTNMFGRSLLYRNNGNGTFTEVTEQALGRTSWGAIGSKAFDYDNDGKLDLLIVDMHSDMWLPPHASNDEKLVEYIRTHENARYKGVSGPVLELDKRKTLHESKLADTFQIDYKRVIFGNTLFKNLGGGRFQEVGERAGIETFWPWGIAVGDFDNDGFEDFFLPSGMGYPYFYWPNRLMMNRGNGTFAERSTAEGMEPPLGGIHQPNDIGGKPATRSSRCAAVADFRNVGRLDIVVNNFNDAPYYFQNQFPMKNYISFRLQGSKSNRDAIGALARLYIGDKVLVRQVHAAGGYLSHSSRTLHFGLGDHKSVDRLEIRWPSGIVQTIQRPAVNRRHDIVEPARSSPTKRNPIEG